MKCAECERLETSYKLLLREQAEVVSQYYAFIRAKHWLGIDAANAAQPDTVGRLRVVRRLVAEIRHQRDEHEEQHACNRAMAVG
jgi:hypothetical protein